MTSPTCPRRATLEPAVTLTSAFAHAAGAAELVGAAAAVVPGRPVVGVDAPEVVGTRDIGPADVAEAGDEVPPASGEDALVHAPTATHAVTTVPICLTPRVIRVPFP